MTMASRILGTEHFPEALTAVLLAKAEGVPLFVEEMVKTLLDIGALRRKTAATAWCRDSPRPACPTPCRTSLWRAWTVWGRRANARYNWHR